LDASDYDEQRLASCFVCADVTDTCLNWAMMNEYYWPFLERWHHWQRTTIPRLLSIHDMTCRTWDVVPRRYKMRSVGGHALEYWNLRGRSAPMPPRSYWASGVPSGPLKCDEADQHYIERRNLEGSSLV